MKRKDDLRLSAVDARVDQAKAALIDSIRKDITAFGVLAAKLRDPKAGAFNEDEMWMTLRLANYACAILAGQLLGRDV